MTICCVALHLSIFEQPLKNDPFTNLPKILQDEEPRGPFLAVDLLSRTQMRF